MKSKLGGLLQLGSRRYSRPAAGPAAVRLECRRPFGLLSEAVRTHTVKPRIVAGSRIQTGPRIQAGGSSELYQ